MCVICLSDFFFIRRWSPGVSNEHYRSSSRGHVAAHINARFIPRSSATISHLHFCRITINCGPPPQLSLCVCNDAVPIHFESDTQPPRQYFMIERALFRALRYDRTTWSQHRKRFARNFVQKYARAYIALLCFLCGTVATPMMEIRIGFLRQNFGWKRIIYRRPMRRLGNNSNICGF